jgi:putative transposase
MLSLKNIQKQNNLLHIYNRGNRKQLIGHDIDDFKYLRKLLLYNFSFLDFDLICFCIMPNHYHVLVIQKGNVQVGVVMQKIGAIYTKHINRKYGYCGHLFQSTYKYKIVTHPNQLKIIYNYILKNPEKSGLPTKQPWLEYNEFLAEYYLINFPEKN